MVAQQPSLLKQLDADKSSQGGMLDNFSDTALVQFGCRV